MLLARARGRRARAPARCRRCGSGPRRSRARSAGRRRRAANSSSRPGSTRSSRHDREVDLGKQRAGARLVGRGGEDDAARVGERVERLARPSAPVELGDDRGSGRGSRSASGSRRSARRALARSSHSPVAEARRPSRGSSRPDAHALPGPERAPPSGCPSRASAGRQPVAAALDHASDQSVNASALPPRAPRAARRGRGEARAAARGAGS